MKYEDAILRIKACQKHLDYCDACEYKNDCSIYDLEDTAIQALEKQIPKDIIEKADSYSYCPECDAVLSANFYKAKYCHNCGQALNWNNEK